jgi:hypothetical protein
MVEVACFLSTKMKNNPFGVVGIGIEYSADLYLVRSNPTRSQSCDIRIYNYNASVAVEAKENICVFKMN